MNFVISAGAVAPDRITFTHPDEIAAAMADVAKT
jgi:hypothetical protein